MQAVRSKESAKNNSQTKPRESGGESSLSPLDKLRRLDTSVHNAAERMIKLLPKLTNEPRMNIRRRELVLQAMFVEVSDVPEFLSQLKASGLIDGNSEFPRLPQIVKDCFRYNKVKFLGDFALLNISPAHCNGFSRGVPYPGSWVDHQTPWDAPIRRTQFRRLYWHPCVSVDLGITGNKIFEPEFSISEIQQINSTLGAFGLSVGMNAFLHEFRLPYSTIRKGLLKRNSKSKQAKEKG